MLNVLRRVFSFSSWTVDHPMEPPPGNMLDASFDAQNQKIAELEALIADIRRSDGRIQNGVVSFDSLEPQLKNVLGLKGPPVPGQQVVAGGSESGEAEAWADTSRLWAEHMPDTIPGNSLAEMDITGDHWSSRWWAHQAALFVGSKTGGVVVSDEPPPDPHMGMLWWSSITGDLHTWYIDQDSAQWVKINTAGNGPPVRPEMFGAVGNGLADDSAAINAALASVAANGGGLVYLSQTYYVASTITVPAKCVLSGNSEHTIGSYTSAIIGALALTPIVRLDGGGAGASTAIERVSIDRAAGTVPDDAIGVQVVSSDMNRIVDCFIRRNAYAIDINTGHTGNRLERVQTVTCHKGHLRLRGGAQTTVMDCYFGKNGGTDVACESYVEVDTSAAGVIDTVNFIRCQFNQSAGGVGALMSFKSYGVGVPANGGFKFVACHAENFNTTTGVVIKADGATTVLPEIQIDKLTTIYTSQTTLNFFDVPTTTQITLLVFDGGTTFNFNIPANNTSDVRIGGYIGRNVTCPEIRRFGLSGAYLLGTLTIGTGVALRVFGSGFYVHGATTLSGVLTGMLHGHFAGGLTDTSTGQLDLNGAFASGTIPTLGLKHSSEYMQLKDAHPFKILSYFATADGSGNASINHSGGTTHKRTRMCEAFYQDAAGATKPMTVSFIDGTRVSLTGGAGAASRPCQVSLMVTNAAFAGW